MISKAQAKHLRALVTKLVNAEVADSRKGGGYPEDIPAIEKDLKRARLNLNHFIDNHTEKDSVQEPDSASIVAPDAWQGLDGNVYAGDRICYTDRPLYAAPSTPTWTEGMLDQVQQDTQMLHEKLQVSPPVDAQAPAVRWDQDVIDRAKELKAAGEVRMHDLSVPIDWILGSQPSDAQADTSKQCKCSFRIKMVGDGCEVCNPKFAADLVAEDAQAARDAVVAAAKNLVKVKGRFHSEQAYQRLVDAVAAISKEQP